MICLVWKVWIQLAGSRSMRFLGLSMLIGIVTKLSLTVALSLGSVNEIMCDDSALITFHNYGASSICMFIWLSFLCTFLSLWENNWQVSVCSVTHAYDWWPKQWDSLHWLSLCHSQICWLSVFRCLLWICKEAKMRTYVLVLSGPGEQSCIANLLLMELCFLQHLWPSNYCVLVSVSHG